MTKRLLGLWLIAMFAAGLRAEEPAPAAAPPAAETPAASPPPPSEPPAAVAPDAAREKAIADRLASLVAPEEILWLDVDGAKVLALYAEQTTAQPKGAAVILHGMDGTPDRGALIHLLRTELPDSGWSTLAVQLPVLPPGSPRAAYAGTLEAAGKRIAAAVAYLKSRQLRNIVVVGHELGAAAAVRFASGGGVQALAALSLSAVEDILAPAELADAIGKLTMPVLDLDGTDLAAAREQLANRRLSAARKAGNSRYAQAVLAGTDEAFSGVAEAVLARLRGWLDKAAPGMTLVAPEARPSR